MKKIMTLRDAERERQRYDYTDRELRQMERAREDEEKRQVVLANPDIGMLMRKGQLVYYINDPDYREARDPRDLL